MSRYRKSVGENHVACIVLWWGAHMYMEMQSSWNIVLNFQSEFFFWEYFEEISTLNLVEISSAYLFIYWLYRTKNWVGPQPKSVVKMPRIHAREACLNKFIAQSKEALESCSKFDDIKMTEMPQFFDVASPEFLEVP